MNINNYTKKINIKTLEELSNRNCLIYGGKSRVLPASGKTRHKRLKDVRVKGHGDLYYV